MTTEVIGLTGKAQVGKDTAARYLCSRHGFVQVNFADALRRMALAIDPYVFVTPQGRPIRYSEACGNLGYDQAKLVYPEMRRFLQVLGTEAVRDIVGRDTWLRLWEREATKHRKVVVSDVRFENELELVCEWGGVVARVESSVRGGLSGANANHPSELPLPAHHIITNDGTHEELYAQLDRLLEKERSKQG